MIRLLLISVIFLLSVNCEQSYSQESKAYKKKGLSYKTPLLKPKYPSYNLAATYMLTQKAKRGDPFAQHELGIRYILGVGIPKDSVKAAHWIKEAASKNLPAANFNYGIMLLNGIGVDWNPFDAFTNFKVSAASGMVQAQYILGLTYTDNLVVSKDMTKAYNWLKKSADKGFEEAKKVIIELNKNNSIVLADSSLKDEDITYSISNEANSSNFTNYDLEYYDFDKDTLTVDEEIEYLNEVMSSDKDELKKMLKVEFVADSTKSKDTSATGIINFAALSGSPEALLLNGRFFEHGIGKKKNLITASANYLKAFRLGSYKAAELLLEISQDKGFYKKLESEIKNKNPFAMYVWAGLVGLGMNYSLTQDQALDLLKKAQKQNHIDSIIELGLAYYTGTIVVKDTIKAINYFNEAIELGSSEAQIRLALINIQKNGSSEMADEISILNKYANNGSVLAVAALAFCYEKGLGVDMKKAKAAKLYRKAAQRGNEAAFNSLQKMYDSLRPPDEEFQIYF